MASTFSHIEHAIGAPSNGRAHAIRRLLVANRGEIAIRIFRAASEIELATVAIFSEEDRFAMHRFKADESYVVGARRPPVQAYLDIDDILRIAREADVDAIHPGYGFLAENPSFAEACAEAGITFIGPSPDVLRRLGNKIAARELAMSIGLPVVPATGPLPDDLAACLRLAQEVGFPVILKASWGGGGRGMRVISAANELEKQVAAGRRESEAAFGNSEVYLEKFLRRARHIEVQILADRYGNVVHLGERDCSLQRRHQKVVEEAPARNLSETLRGKLHAAAVALARAVGYESAGTVEFLLDLDTERFHFIEVNPRIQVEHTVTEMVTGIDMVKAQIRIAAGAVIGSTHSGVPTQKDIVLRGHAVQCRITTEDPANGFTPDYGTISAYRSATGFGIRLDGSTAYSGAVITPYYDSLLVKVTACAPTFEDARMQMVRALREFRIRGVATNLAFLDVLLAQPAFHNSTTTTRFIDETPALLNFTKPRDRASRLLEFIGEVIVNGNAEVEGRPKPERLVAPRTPLLGALSGKLQPGSRDRLKELGVPGFVAWMRAESRLLVTDTTFRDAHQSLLATRFRTNDLVRIAPAYARLLPGLFSIECWGGATFDVALRYLKEDPWERLAALREQIPNVLLQMLLRGANAVGYTNYPDNVVRYFVQQAAAAGVDLFRVFDSLNWVESMRVAIDAVVESGALCEAAMCYTGDITDPRRDKYGLRYYVALAKELEAAGTHILGIKDMAGLCKPEAARRLVAALKDAVGIPIHFHTHDTSGNSGASVLAAVEAGVDAADAAVDAMSGLTSQPNLGAIVASLQHGPRDTGLDQDAIRSISAYWEDVRGYYRPFESEMRAGSSDVYEHGMPGGQYTNLREQAQAMGLGERWPEVTKTYAAVNELFGDVIKVTPTSKAVGDMTLFMMTSGLSTHDVLEARKELAFPQSVVEFFHGDIGQPPGGFPADLQRKVLKGRPPLTVRAGQTLASTDLEQARSEAEERVGYAISDADLASYLMYPEVFVAFRKHLERYGDVHVLPTSVYFYGMSVGQEVAVALERGKTLIIRYAALSDPDEDGFRTVFFELNGQPRSTKILDLRVAPARTAARKADEGNPLHVAAPMPGLIVRLCAQDAQCVHAGDPLLTLEAMKMQTVIYASGDGEIASVLVAVGSRVAAGDLLIELKAG